jgi:hypothetical protein
MDWSAALGNQLSGGLLTGSKAPAEPPAAFREAVLEVAKSLKF